MARKGYKCETFVWNGKRVYCYGKTQQEAHDNAVRKKALLEANVRESKIRMTVERWSKKWLKDYKKGAVSDAWYNQMDGIIENHILPYIGDKLMRDVTASDIQRMMNQNARHSESHQKKIAQIMMQILSSAEENDVIVKVPTRRIKTSVRADKASSRTLTDNERSLTLRTADKYPNEGLFFLITLFCGLRPGEVARLKMRDYDKDALILRVHEARKADGSTGTPKSQSGIREIPVPTYLAERLNKLDKKKNELIVTSAQGHPLTKTSQKRMWNRFKRYMDIENGAEVFRGGIVESTLADDLRPYCYRHTYCTDLQDAGVPITVAQRLMGHADIKTTAQIYTHHSQKSFEDARDKINKHCGTTCGTYGEDAEKSASGI